MEEPKHEKLSEYIERRASRTTQRCQDTSPVRDFPGWECGWPPNYTEVLGAHQMPPAHQRASATRTSDTKYFRW